MSFIGNKILLGYEDEPVTEKYKDHTDFKTNKIGGKPNWMLNLPQVTCKLCGFTSPLILQIYAPMKNSPYHRTLHIFACINPNCWNKNESWICLRSQVLDAPETRNPSVKAEATSEPASFWCSSSDSWGDEEDNGNLDYLNELIQNKIDLSGFAKNVSEIDQGLSQMSFNEKNHKDKTEGKFIETSPCAVAMIEGNDGEVCVDTPILPVHDLNALLQQPAAVPSLPDCSVEFSSFFVSVDEEDLSRVGLSDEELIVSKIRDYRASQMGEEDMMTSSSGENYEKSLPAHGDKMFHRFLTRIQANPGQIIRYGGYPLWLYPSDQTQFCCQYCGGDSAFEMQILPTLIPKLFLNGSTGHLEFGSVFIYSCLAGCWDPQQSQPRCEIVIVQKEVM